MKEKSNEFVSKFALGLPKSRCNLTASELRERSPGVLNLDKMEQRILKMLSGWSILDIECLLIHRVLPEAKRQSRFKG